MIFDGLSDEELDKYIAKDTFILMKCEKCGYEEQVPSWVLAEFQDIDRYKGKKNPIKTCMCVECQGTMYQKEK